MADRYWVGGAGAVWDTNTGTKWATTPGGAGGASAPTFADDVFFDAASGARQVFFSTVACNNLTTTGFTGTLEAQFSNDTLSINGNLVLGSTMGTNPVSTVPFGKNLTSSCQFVGGTTQTITSNGIPFSFVGTFGTRINNFFGVTLLDNFRSTGTVLLSANNNTLNLNNFTFTLTSGSYLELIAASSGGPTLAFGSTGKIIIQTTTTIPIRFTTTVSNTALTITGSRNVEVDVTSAVTLGQSTSINYFGEAFALNYTSTAANQSSFRLYLANNVDWSLGTGSIIIDRTDNYVFGNFITAAGTITKNLSAGSNCNLTFNASSGTKTINCPATWTTGIAITIQPTAASVTYNLASAITQDNNVRNTFAWSSSVAATFNTNNFNITTGGFSAGGGTCNLGTSQISSYGNNFGFPTPYLISFGSGVSANNATIRAIGFSSRVLASNMTIGTLQLATSAGQTITIPTTSTNLTINTLSNSVSPAAITFPSGLTTTVNNFNLNGTAGNLVTVRSTTAGAAATLTKASGTVNVSYLDLRDSNATGGATWTSLITNGNVNSGNNSGWDFGVVFVDGVSATGQVGILAGSGTPVKYWVGGTGTWDSSSTANWSNTSGGASGASVPTSLDLAVFDANSGVVNVTIGSGAICGALNCSVAATVNFSNTLTIAGDDTVDTISGNTMRFTTTTVTTGTRQVNFSYSGSNARTITTNNGFAEADALNTTIQSGTGTINISTNSRLGTLAFLSGFSGNLSTVGNPIRIFGSLVLSANMTVAGPSSSSLVMAATSVGNKVITTNGVFVNRTLVINPIANGSANFILNDNYAGRSLTIGTQAGTFDTFFNRAISVQFLNFSTSITSGYVAANFNASPINITGTLTSGYNTVSWGSSTVNLASAAILDNTFNYTFYNLNISGTSASILGSGIFNSITNSTQPSTVTFGASTTQGVNTFGLSGTAGNLVTINSSSPGTQFTLSKSSGLVNASYLAIQDSNATGGATWRALVTNGNVNLGNNTGWDFNSAYVDVTGVSASGAVGIVTALATNDVDVVGVQATGEVGNVTVFTTQNINVNLAGVSATGQVGNLFFYQWSTIIDTQDPSWVPINDLQTPTWATINPNNSPVWTDVVI